MLLQRYHILPVIYFCHILACEGVIFVEMLDIFDFLRLGNPKLRD